MVNEDLLRFLNERIGSEVAEIQIPDEFKDQELYVAFRSKQLDKLPFIITLEGYDFREVNVLFNVVSWERNAVKVIYSMNMPLDRAYNLPIGLIGSENIAIFAPLIASSESSSKRSNLEDWVNFRFLGKSLDRLSNFLNKELDPTKLMKNLACRFQYQKGKDIFILSNPATISFTPKQNGELNVTLMEFYKFNIKKDNFLPKFNISKQMEVIQTILIKYKEFLNNYQLINYPRNNFLSGPEAFVCNNCQSIIFPESVAKVQMPLYIMKLPGHLIRFTSKCPKCNQVREVWSMKDDALTIKTGNVLFWLCPTHLKPYNIIKESNKKGKKVLSLECPEGCKKVSKEFEEQYTNEIKRDDTISNHNYKIDPNSKMVSYNY
jgi:hypothetical protein